MKIETVILDSHLYKDYPLPSRGSEQAAGIDLLAAENSTLTPGTCTPIKTGLAIAIPKGYAGLVLPRSGLGGKDGLVLGNSVGLIDSDYRGEFICYMWNRNEVETKKNLVVYRGMRFAQLVIVPYLTFELSVVEAFSEETERGTGGFGSTGNG